MNASPVVVILAAGLGARFRAAGGQTHKLEATLTTASGTRTVLGHVIAAAQASGLAWHVVRAPLDAVSPEPGMGASIAQGVKATPDAPGWLILPGDMPLVRPQTLRQVADALRHHPLVVPVVGGQRGHPVGFGKGFQSALTSLRGDQGGRRLLEAHTPFRLELDDVGCTLDIDTPEQLARVQRWAARA